MKKSIGAKTITYPTPAWVVCTYDREGRANGMTAAWGGICSSKPPAVTVSIRPSRYTYDNLMERKAFTINVPSEAHVKEVDYFGIVSGRKEDKFAAARLTPVKSELVDAPYIAEFPLVMECRLLQTVEVGVHVLFIGEIVDVKVEESALGENGMPEVERLRPLVYATGNEEYYGIGRHIGRAFSAGRDV